jgi:hypothetical protein
MTRYAYALLENEEKGKRNKDTPQKVTSVLPGEVPVRLTTLTLLFDCDGLIEKLRYNIKFRCQGNGRIYVGIKFYIWYSGERLLKHSREGIKHWSSFR